MNAHTPINQSPVFADYLVAARANLAALVAKAHELRDHEFASEAQALLDNYDTVAADAWAALESDEARASESYVPSFGMQHPDSPSFGRGF